VKAGVRLEFRVYAAGIGEGAEPPEAELQTGLDGRFADAPASGGLQKFQITLQLFLMGKSWPAWYAFH